MTVWICVMSVRLISWSKMQITLLCYWQYKLPWERQAERSSKYRHRRSAHRCPASGPQCDSGAGNWPWINVQMSNSNSAWRQILLLVLSRWSEGRRTFLIGSRFITRKAQFMQCLIKNKTLITVKELFLKSFWNETNNLHTQFNAFLAVFLFCVFTLVSVKLQ